MTVKSSLSTLILLFVFGGLSENAFSQHVNHYEEVKSNVNFPKGFDETKSKEIITTVAIEKLNLIKNGISIFCRNICLFLYVI